MIHFVICEDEVAQRELLRDYIQKMMLAREEGSKILAYESGEQLLNHYPSQADVIFLDIQMGQMSGIETAKAIRKFDEEVALIFVTGDPGFMQKGYEVDARRYLLKPISYEEFEKQVTPCIQKISEKRSHYIWIKSEYNDYKILVSQIKYAEKVGRKLILHTESRIYETCMSMKELEERLGEDYFMRCHKSFFVNLMKVEGIEKDRILLGGEWIPVGRLLMKTLKKQLLEVLGAKVC
ncbi:MAG: LytR/AlgR family response regulator transcription factor [Cellulosilyticaceae bacterium]